NVSLPKLTRISGRSFGQYTDGDDLRSQGYAGFCFSCLPCDFAFLCAVRARAFVCAARACTLGAASRSCARQIRALVVPESDQLWPTRGRDRQCPRGGFSGRIHDASVHGGPLHHLDLRPLWAQLQRQRTDLPLRRRSRLGQGRWTRSRIWRRLRTDSRPAGLPLLLRPRWLRLRPLLRAGRRLGPYGWSGGGAEPYSRALGDLWIGGSPRFASIPMPTVTLTATSTPDNPSTIHVVWKSPASARFTVYFVTEDGVQHSWRSSQGNSSATFQGKVGQTYWFWASATSSLGWTG